MFPLQAIMTHEEGISQKDLEKNMRIKNHSQVPTEGQDDFNISEVNMRSRKRPNEITEDQNQNPHSFKKTRHDWMSPSDKSLRISLHGNYKKNENMSPHSERINWPAVLNMLRNVTQEIEKNPSKEMLVYDKEEYMNFGMPLSCLPEDINVVITFSRSKTEQKEGKSVFDRQNQASVDYVQFYILAVGKGNKRILRREELHREGNKLCVRGSKGETIKDTLLKDGRFESFVENDHWKLITELGTILENSQLVDELEGKLFQIEVEMEKTFRAMAAAQNSKVEQRNFQELKECIVNEYPSLTRQREKIRTYIKEESDKRKNETSLIKVHKTNFGKLTKNSTPVKIQKRLSETSNSVGYICWNNNGREGFATCFVFTGPYIFTCRHVISDIVGKGTEPSQWAGVISQCVKVIFDYEESPVTEDKCFLVAPWFEISDVTLDYAVLQLTSPENENHSIPVGLYHGHVTMPSSGSAYIIGHPDKGGKVTDACTVIPQHEQERECQEGNSSPMQYIYMHTQKSFQENQQDSDMVTNHDTFYCGSSGSPVFDSKGSLVAMLTAGFICEYENRVSSIIEFGCTMEAILADIQQKNEPWYDKECVILQDVEMPSLERIDS